MEQKKNINILIIVSDQQNIDAIAAYKNYFKDKAYHCHWVKTPHFDRLIEKGYSFIESHSTNPVCCPARSSIFTGRYSIETGLYYNNIGIDEKVKNMGQWFEQHGNYKRVYCGKWHAGGQWDYPDVEGERKIPGFETLPVGVTGTGDLNDSQVASALGGFIRNYNGEKAFLAVAGLMNPHDICYWIPKLWGKFLVPETDEFNLGDTRPPLPPNFEISFKDPSPNQQEAFTTEEWRNYLYDYQRMIERLDSDLGKLLSAVESRKDETLVIFTSDHGDGAARHKRVQKWHPFEESVKVPLIFCLPGKIKAGIVDTKNIVSGIDIMPTVCDFAGIPQPEKTMGRSLKTLLETGKTEMVMDTAFMEFQWTNRIVRKGDFKFIKYYQKGADNDKPFIRKSDGGEEKFQACDGRVRYKEGQKLLFNIKEDPWETKDLINDPNYLNIAENLEKILAEDWEMKVIPGTHFDRN